MGLPQCRALTCGWLASHLIVSNVRGFQWSQASLSLSDLFLFSPSRWARAKSLHSSLTLALSCRRFLLSWLGSLLSVHVCSGRHRRSGPDDISSGSTPSSPPRSPSAMNPLLDLPSPRRHCGNMHESWTRMWPLSHVRLKFASSRLLWIHLPSGSTGVKTSRERYGPRHRDW
jgi:hypothetical protein